MMRRVSGPAVCQWPVVAVRPKSLVNASILHNVSSMIDEKHDNTAKKVYAQRRQVDAKSWSVKEKEAAIKRTKEQLDAQDKVDADIAAAAASGGTTEEKPKGYVKSTAAFGDASVKLQHSFTGLADNRVILWWEDIYWNWLRWFFTGEYLIAKDRYGNKFAVSWLYAKSREERRLAYRKDSNKKHLPYGALPTDERQWERWLRGHRGDPPSVAEEEYLRSYKKQYLGPMVVGDEEVEDTMMRMIAHMHRSQSMMKELDDNQVYTDQDRVLQPLRQAEANPGQEHAAKEKAKGATWTMGFVQGNLFYNEEEAQAMRTEMGHVFRNMEWQELEYKRHIRSNKAQWPVRKPAEGTTSPHDGDGDPFLHTWERTDMAVPYHDGVSDLTTPELERLRIEADQLEDERLAIRKELGLTDLGDIREGRPPIKQEQDPYQPPPVNARWKPKTWEEGWGTGGGNRW